jgi:heme oxygenase (mycobilin-producing)
MPARTYKGRVVFLIRLKPGAAGAFLAAYERIHHDVAGVRGHIVDQVCRLRDGKDSWLITSEWERLECFLEWERTEAHRELAKPLRDCIASAQSMKFDVIEETRSQQPSASADAPDAERGIHTWFDAA